MHIMRDVRRNDLFILYESVQVWYDTVWWFP